MRGMWMLGAAALCLGLMIVVPAAAEEAGGSGPTTEGVAATPVGSPAPVTPAGNGKGKGGGAEECFCSATADCGGGETVSCTDSTSPCDCQGVDRDCSLYQRGQVQCNNGAIQYCSEPCPFCRYHFCETGRSCFFDDDCCGLPNDGYCYIGQCVCL